MFAGRQGKTSLSGQDAASFKPTPLGRNHKTVIVYVWSNVVGSGRCVRYEPYGPPVKSFDVLVRTNGIRTMASEPRRLLLFRGSE